jgi:hypothetical protein
MFFRVLFVSLLFITTVSSNVTAGENYLCTSNATAELPKNAQKLLILDQNTQQKLAYIDETTYTLSETNGVLAGQSKTSNAFIIFQSNVLELISGNNTWKGSCRKLSENNTVSSTVKSKKKTCNEDVTACTNKQVCKKGTRNHNGRKKWDTRESYYRFYTEARKRKLSCGIKTTTLNSLTQTSTNKFKEYKCKMNMAWNSNGYINEETWYMISPDSVQAYGWLKDKAKNGRYIQTIENSGKYKWSEVWGVYNSSNTFTTIDKELQIFNNNKKIKLKIHIKYASGFKEYKYSDGSCKPTGKTK